MMRRFIAGLLILGGLCGTNSYAAISTIERDYPCTDAFAVTLTTFSWTAVPATNCAGRVKVLLNVPYSNTGAVSFILSTASTTPTVSTNTASIELSTATKNDNSFPFSDETYLFGISRNVGGTPSTIYGQELKSR